MLKDVIAAALAEDLGEAGDVTAAATVPASARLDALLVAREPAVVAGVDAACAVFSTVDAEIACAPAARDGDRVAAGAVLARVSGPARSVLTAERTALNLLGHLCGVATATARYVDAVAGTGCAIRDTRKTLPGLRALQKAAVAAGGGANHRMSLSDGLLVKDNHVVAAGGIGAAAKLALAAAGGLSVQIEVDDLDELEQALAAGARSVLLDNFEIADMVAGVARCRSQPEPVFIEASGGITLDNAARIAATGVDAVAVGALTHSVRAVDVALDAEVRV